MRYRCICLTVLLAVAEGAGMLATSYVPISDTELARRATVIVRARVDGQRVEVERLAGREVPVTIVTLETLEAFKGSPGPRLELRLPGGRAGSLAMSVPGTPAFRRGDETVLFLDQAAGEGPAYRLSELGLSKFDLVSDATGRRFAMRSVFSPESDLVLSAREAERGPGAAREKGPVPIRDAGSFLESLRALRRGEPMAAAAVALPTGGLPGAIRRKWVNQGGVEPGNPYCESGPCLYRWFWERPPVFPYIRRIDVVGEQSNLFDDEPNCGTSSLCHLTSAVAQWRSVQNVAIGYGEIRSWPAGSTTTAELQVFFDLDRDLWGGHVWSTPADCSGGVAAISLYFTAIPDVYVPYRGDSYLPGVFAEIDVRRSVCERGLRARDFGSIVIHEVGHTLGLGHSDEGASIHSTTTPDDWSNAVMFSSRPLSEPLTPQTDDIAAIRYYYGLDLLGSPPVASFTFSPSQPVSGDIVTFTDTSTESPIAWNWTVGVPFAGGVTTSEREPRIGLLSAGVYPVELRVANGFGTATVTGDVTVGSAAGSTCVADAQTLCLKSGRFKTVADWTKPSGQSGWGTGVPLTSDSGYFWFFDPNNIEVVVKVLDGCSTPSHSYWVFAAGLTNLGSNLVVVDTTTGAFRAYTNPVGTPYQPVQDTAAFPCP